MARDASARLAAVGWRADVEETTGAGSAATLARDADLAAYDGIAAVGGDGTLHEVVNGLAARADRRAPPIAVFPGGTSNSFVHTLGTADPGAIVAAIVARRSVSVDAADVRLDGEACVAVSIVHCGMTVSAALKAERLRWLGAARYQLGALAALLLPRRRRYAIEVDDAPLEAVATILLQLTRGPARGESRRWCLAPRVRMDDGRVDLITLAPMSLRRRARVFARSRDGSYVDEPGVDYRKADRVRFSVPGGEFINVDGEFRRVRGGAVEVCARPAAFRVFRPLDDSRSEFAAA